MKAINTAVIVFLFTAVFSLEVSAQRRARIASNHTSVVQSGGQVTRNGARTGGRTNGIAVDPIDRSGNTYYVGSANGGVWRNNVRGLSSGGDRPTESISFNFRSSNSRSRTETVGNNETITIGGNRTENISSRSVTIGAAQTINVGGYRGGTTVANGSNLVQGNYIGTNAVGTIQ